MIFVEENFVVATTYFFLYTCITFSQYKDFLWSYNSIVFKNDEKSCKALLFRSWIRQVEIWSQKCSNLKNLNDFASYSAHFLFMNEHKNWNFFRHLEKKKLNLKKVSNSDLCNLKIYVSKLVRAITQNLLEQTGLKFNIFWE